MSFRDASLPRLFGHRGAPEEAPENTMASFKRAVAHGADHLELDVHLTSDHHVVVFHDPTVERTRVSEARVSDLSLAALQALAPRDAALEKDTEVPLLADVLAGFPSLRLNIELKAGSTTGDIVAATLRVIDSFGALSRVLLAAEEDEIMTEIRRASPEATTGSSAMEVARFLGDPSFTPPGFALQVPVMFGTIPIVTPDFITRAHACGREVHVWTVNDPGEMRALLDQGVDGIITDRPGVGRAAIDAFRS